VSNELIDQLKPKIDAFLVHIAGFAAEDIAKYGQDLTEDFTNFLYKSVAADDQTAKRNLSHLRAQAKLLINKHQIHADEALVAFLMNGLDALAGIGLILLRTNLPTA